MKRELHTTKMASLRLTDVAAKVRRWTLEAARRALLALRKAIGTNCEAMVDE